MTGGIGFTSLMRSISKTNRSFLKHPNKVRSQKDNLTYLTDKSPLQFKDISEEDLEKYKTKLRLERKAEQRRDFWILTITILVIAFLILIVYFIVIK
jgi:hypothetical protein